MAGRAKPTNTFGALAWIMCALFLSKHTHVLPKMNFENGSNIGSSSSPHPVICVDSDGDGDFDLVEAVGKLHKVVHHSNDGSAQFTSSSTRAVRFNRIPNG